MNPALARKLLEADDVPLRKIVSLRERDVERIVEEVTMFEPVERRPGDNRKLVNECEVDFAGAEA